LESRVGLLPALSTDKTLPRNLSLTKPKNKGNGILLNTIELNWIIIRKRETVQTGMNYPNTI
jgi:hypothetical protein